MEEFVLVLFSLKDVKMITIFCLFVLGNGCNKYCNIIYTQHPSVFFILCVCPKMGIPGLCIAV